MTPGKIYVDPLMRKVYFVVLVLAFLLWTSLAISYVMPNSFTELFELMDFWGLIIGLPMAVIIGIARCGFSLYSCLILPLAGIGFIQSIWFVAPFKNALDDWWLKQHLGEYVDVVNDIKSGFVKTSQGLSIIDISQIKNLPERVTQVRAARCSHGTIVVEFLLSNEGRVKRGYLFDDCDDPVISVVNNISPVQRVHSYPVVGRWYEFSD